MDLQDVYNQIDLLYGQYSFQELREPLERLVYSQLERLSPDSPQRIGLHTELGGYYRHSGEYELAEMHFLQAKMLYERQLNRRDINYGTILNNLAGLYRLMNRNEEAEACFIHAAKIYREIAGEDSVLYSGLLNNLSLLYEQMGKHAEAARLSAQTVDILQRIPLKKDDKLLLGVAYENRGAILTALGQYPQAMEAYQNARTVFEREGEGRSNQMIALWNGMAKTQYRAGMLPEAETFARNAVQLAREISGDQQEDTAISLLNLASIVLTQGDACQAVILAEEARRIRATVFGEDSLQAEECDGILSDAKGQLDRHFSVVRSKENPMGRDENSYDQSPCRQ